MEQTKNILIAGAGKIGTTLAALLATIKQTQIILVDKSLKNCPSFITQKKTIERYECDVTNASVLFELIQKKQITAIVSCLPYFCNFSVAEVAKANNCHYFDLTEDVGTTRDIFRLAQNAQTAFVPQCGIAPGFINVVANDLIKQCDSIETVKLYCGALPQKSTYPMGYALTWSTEGLINEYANPARVIKKSQLIETASLTGIENLILNNEAYEAFYTSGGIGTLVDTYKDKVQTMYYKSIRYPGHYKKIKFLMQDLKLINDRPTLKRILENALPTTENDFVIMHIVVKGIVNNKPCELIDTRRFYPEKISTQKITAIQFVTSTAAAVTIDTVLSNPNHYRGPIKQEDFKLNTLLRNPLATYLKGQ